MSRGAEAGREENVTTPTPSLPPSLPPSPTCCKAFARMTLRIFSLLLLHRRRLLLPSPRLAAIRRRVRRRETKAGAAPHTRAVSPLLT